MTAETLQQQPANDDSVSADHKRNRKEVIALGFQNKTKGEALFNGISYIGFGYFLVTGVSVLMTFLMQDTKGPLHEWAQFSKGLIGKIKRNGKEVFPESFSNITALFTGGTIASVLPVKWFEDHKPLFVKKFDHLFYTDEQYNNDPRIRQTHKELDELPKQTWTSVGSSRIVAFLATLGVFALMGSNKSPFYKLTKSAFGEGQSLDKFSIKFGRRIDRMLNGHKEGVAEAIDRAIANNETKMKFAAADNKLPRDHEVIQSGENADRIPSRIFSYIGLDALYTMVTSATLWTSTRVFGGVLGKTASNGSLGEKPNILKPVAANDDEFAANDRHAPVSIHAPRARVMGTIHHEQRLAEPQQSAELTA